MAMNPQTFINMAAGMIGGSFAAFAKDAVFTKASGFDYETQKATTKTQTIKMIRIDYKQSQYQSSLIKLADFQLIGEAQKLKWELSTDDTFCTFDGKNLVVSTIDIDPATATVIIGVKMT